MHIKPTSDSAISLNNRQKILICSGSSAFLALAGLVTAKVGLGYSTDPSGLVVFDNLPDSQHQRTESRGICIRCNSTT